MEYLYLYKPAFWAHIISSLAMVTAIILLVINWNKVVKLQAIELIKLFAILTIAIGSHSQGHINLEREYNYDPVKYLIPQK
jgi:hypothetical protein